jgi:tetratricopeptide (TPR) repeat protein
MLFDARSGQQMAAMSDESPEDALPELARRCAGRIRAQLGVRLPAAAGLPSFQSGAMEQYAQGMERLRLGDALGARSYLDKAILSAPSSPLFHSGLAASLSALGLDTQAGHEAKLALDSSGDLGRVEQLEIEGLYRTTAHDWARGIQVYQALFTLLPDDLEYGLLLASAESHGGQGQEALRTVKTLRSLPPPLGDDPRVDMAEAQAAGALSDFAHTQKAAHSAAGKANARGARLQYAKARLLESGAMQNLKTPGFEQLRAEARGICAELGDRLCVAAAYRIEANQRAVAGQLAVARQLYNSAFEIANQIGNSNEKLNALSGLANAAKLQGDLRASEGYSRAALPIASDLGPQKCHPVYLDLADVLAESGRISEARGFIEQALRIARQIGEREGIGLGEAALAHTLALEGQSAAALGEYKQALAILREVNDPFDSSETLVDFGDAQIDQGDLAGARKSFEEARTLAHDIPGQPEIELGWAHLSFAEGQFANAAAHARSALNQFTSSGREADRYQAAAVLSRALLDQGLLADATAVLAQFPAPDATRFPVRSVVQFEIARCFVLAKTGRRAEAMQNIDALIAATARRGIPRFQRDAVLAKKAIARIG